MIEVSNVTASVPSVDKIRQALAEGALSRKEAARLLADNVQRSLALLSGAQLSATSFTHSCSSAAARLLRTLNMCGPSLRIIEVDAPVTLPLSGQYDLVVIAGYHETFASDTNMVDPLSHLLRRAYSALAPGGSVVIAGHNALALRHFNGQRDVYGREGAASVERLFPSGSPKLWSAKAVHRALAKTGFQAQAPCALMGTVAQPRLLVSPQGCELPAERWNLETLVRRALAGIEPERLARFSESRVLSEITRGGALADWSDGYVLLGHKSAAPQFSFGGWLASAFSRQGSGDDVQETRFTIEASNDAESGDIRVETYSQGNVKPVSVTPYINGTVYRDRLDDLLQTPGWAFEQVLQWSAVWLRCLLASIDADEASSSDEPFAASFAGDYDFQVPARLLLATPSQWIQRPDGSFHCLYETAESDGTVPMASVLYVGLLSAFTTLRSVAEPADSAWLEPLALAEAVVGRLGYSISEHDYEVLVLNWQKVSGTQLPKPVAFFARLNQHPMIDEAKLYWATKSEGFSESKTSTDTLNLDGRSQVLRLPIASADQTVTALRFDVANRPGCFDIESMTVLQVNGEVLWRWDHTREALSGIRNATLVLDGRSCLLSRGNDPQLVLNLPEPALCAGGELKVRLSAWPQRLEINKD
ncbi:hypothetical protein QWI17_15980 [Gilvimarinus sp. SDUM040013]|uniref:Class I SAM-dependent methyltransferase n=1 Tax=Gilvimarinus gilvus TaxID=3058038 RepID=A0ABU4RVX6_9GAMM|nr:hypothetical protein [Gilvimarinus sp. SDUM040013]MDO3387340.1 hypothetical protein [Gilvimarinus sp. SDUM040013]MDX6849029.1 hypothetical protein [Gilvimarinus sp. SDUM040013]